MKIFQKSLTLMELMIVIVLIGILATIGIVNFQKTVANAKRKEAQSLLLLIKHAEDVVRAENNTYAACADTATCNTVLRLNLPNPATPTWAYSVSGVTNTTFCALADTSVTGLDDYHIRQGEENATTGGCS